MDVLDRIFPVARALLERVDGTLLAGGAPAGHRVLGLLAAVGALPGDAVAQLAGTAPEQLEESAPALRAYAAGYQDLADSVAPPAAWRGDAAERYAEQWRALSTHLAGGPDTLSARLADTAGYMEEAAAWLRRGRRTLAGVLAECIGSAEAVTLRELPAPAAGPERIVEAWLAGDPVAMGATPTGAVAAAAAIGARVLEAVDEITKDGYRLAERWGGRLDELTYRPPPPPPPGAPGTGLIGLG